MDKICDVTQVQKERLQAGMQYNEPNNQPNGVYDWNMTQELRNQYPPMPQSALISSATSHCRPVINQPATAKTDERQRDIKSMLLIFIIKCQKVVKMGGR